MKMELDKLQESVWNTVATMAGWCDRARCDKLVELVHTHSPYRVVEVGVYGGRSLAALALALEYCCVGYVWGIDPWTNEANLEGEPNEHREFWEKVDMNEIYLQFLADMEARTLDYRHIRARGEDAIRLFQDNSIDLLSLDGNHSELSSCRDVQLWLPKLAAGGHLVMDDTSWSSMQKAVGLVRAAGLQLVHDGGGWAVFQR
jgi:predicted O-methyltransferase YrrM